MANIYVRSTDGNNADNGSTWALAKATIAGALAIAGNGDRIWVSQVHAESQAGNIDIIKTGLTPTQLIEIYCGNDGAQPPTALATTATVTSTAGVVNFEGSFVVYGISFSSGAGLIDLVGAATTEDTETFVLCNFAVLGLLAALQIGPNNFDAARTAFFIDCTLTFNDTTSGIKAFGSRFDWRGGSIALTGSVPAALVVNNYGMEMVFRNVDLSALGSGKALVSTALGTVRAGFENCKLGSAVTLYTGTPGVDADFYIDNSDSADTQYRMQRSTQKGDAYSETTIVRTGGATDGLTPISHRLVSNSIVSFYRPFYGPDLIFYNPLPGSSRTVTVEIVHDSVTALKDSEVWLEAEYLGTSGFPIGSTIRDRAVDVLSTGVAQTSSSVAWTTTGITNVNKQTLSITFTQMERGLVRCRVALAKASYTVYACPKVNIT